MKKIDRRALYHETNEWIRQDGKEYVIGITDFAQTVFGNVVSVDLPEVGSLIETNQELLIVESVKVSTEIFSPVSGEIISINQELKTNPEYLNESPYDKGWLVRIKVSDENELNNLMNADAYIKYMGIFYNKS